MLSVIGSTVVRWGMLLTEMSRAQAQWDIEVSQVILARRKTLLLAMLAPVLVFIALEGAAAADLLPNEIPILGGSKAYMPSYVSSGMFFGSILVGLIAGLITGVIGAGGGYILTPALMSFGVRGIMAVGTDQFHIFAKAIMGTTIHRKLGNVNPHLAAWFVVGSLSGVTIGGNINRAVFQHNPALSDALISTVYVLVLGILGVYAVADWQRLRRADHHGGDQPQTTSNLAKRLQALPLRPQITFDQNIVEGGRRIPVYPVILCGFIVGFVAAIMGVGGGFLTFPMFVYGLGVSTFTTVGTDILQLIFTTSYSSIFQYAIYGFVFYTVAVGMLLGSLIGVQIGAMVTSMVKGSQIRVFYALTILAGFCNRLFALPRKLADLGYLSLPRSVTVCLETVGTVGFFAIVGFFALWILLVFARSVKAARANSSSENPGGRRRLIVHPREFRAGSVGLVLLAAAVVASCLPLHNQQTALEWADNLFNQLAKHSADFIEDGRAKQGQFAGRQIDISVSPKDFVDEGKLAQIVNVSGLEAKVIGDGRVRITGDFGVLAQAALDDAALEFRNQTDELSSKRGMASSEAIYCWWIIFDGLTRRYVQEGRGVEANFTKFISAKVLEPCYNFRGIGARPVRERAVPLAVLLSLYIVFTLWYGFSIMLIFEGLGIGTSVLNSKEE